MFRRSLTDALITALTSQPFWKHLLADGKLSPEVRDGHVTVYYRGGALLKSLRLDGSNLIADVNPKYVPVRVSGSTARVKWSDAGFAFMDSVAALPPGSLTPDVLTAYKEEMGQVLVSFPEGEIVQQIIDRRENIIIDQEIAFQETGSSRDKIDLCHFDSTLQKLVFVEVKRVDDARLFKPDGRPEVLDQLASYTQRLDANRDVIIEAYRNVVAIKRKLGLEGRLKEVPSDGASAMLTKPVLVIGNCSSADVKAIKSGTEEWGPLMASLPSCAAGLILSGSSGCRLALTPGRQTLVF